MPSSAATARARSPSRLAMAVTTPSVPARTPGMKRVRAMRAVLRMPQRSGVGVVTLAHRTPGRIGAGRERDGAGRLLPAEGAGGQEGAARAQRASTSRPSQAGPSRHAGGQGARAAPRPGRPRGARRPGAPGGRGGPPGAPRCPPGGAAPGTGRWPRPGRPRPARSRPSTARSPRRRSSPARGPAGPDGRRGPGRGRAPAQEQGEGGEQDELQDLHGQHGQHFGPQQGGRGRGVPPRRFRTPYWRSKAVAMPRLTIAVDITARASTAGKTDLHGRGPRSRAGDEGERGARC